MTQAQTPQITLLGQTFDLFTQGIGSHRTTYPQLLVNGFPLIAIEHQNGQATTDGLKRAELALLSFWQNSGAYCSTPDLSVVEQAHTLCLSDIPDCRVDHYRHGSKDYLVLERTRPGLPYLHLSVFAPDTVKAVLKALTLEQRQQNAGLLDDLHGRLCT